MSFSHIQGYEPSRSVQIMEDLLFSSYELDQLDWALSSEAISNLPMQIQTALDTVQNISKVYNQNVKYIADELKQFKPVSRPSYAQYLCEKKISYLSKEDYDHETALIEFSNLKRFEEVGQLRQLVLLCDHLKHKITRLTDRIATLNTSVQAISSLDLIPLEKAPTEEVYFYQRLRTIPTTPIVPLNDPSSVSVSIACSVGEGNVFGYCCEPSWTAEPVAFKANENGWVGRAPIGKEYKFVVIRDGQVVKWEEGANRKFDANTTCVVLNADQVRFA